MNSGQWFGVFAFFSFVSVAVQAGNGPVHDAGHAIAYTLSDTPTIQANSNFGEAIVVPATGPSILIVDTQDRVSVDSVKETVHQLQTVLRLPFAFRSQTAGEPIGDAKVALAETNIAVVIVVCDSASYPSLLLAPENRWALVNVAALGGKRAKSDVVTERLHKEIWRAVGFLMGAANSGNQNCFLRPVFSTADLDAIQTKSFAIDNLARILNQSRTMGMKQPRLTSYRKAVEEGWAPAPTNEFQRAIWNEGKK